MKQSSGKMIFLFVMSLLVCLGTFLLTKNLEAAWKTQERRSMLNQQKGKVALSLLSNSRDLADYLVAGETQLLTRIKERKEWIEKLPQEFPELQGDDHITAAITTEQSWYTQFAQPLIERRQLFDNGKSKITDLTFSYIMADPETWQSRIDGSIRSVTAPSEEDIDSGKSVRSAIARVYIVVLASFLVALIAGLGLWTSVRQPGSPTGNYSS